MGNDQRTRMHRTRVLGTLLLWCQMKMLLYLVLIAYYGNRGCRDFKRGLKVESVLPKNKHTQKKSLTFEDWCSGEVSKIIRMFLNFLFFEDYIFCCWHVLIRPIFESHYY